MDQHSWERVGNGVDSTENHTAQEGALGGSGLTPAVKPQWVSHPVLRPKLMHSFMCARINFYTKSDK
jgi:hypothetical protein